MKSAPFTFSIIMFAILVSSLLVGAAIGAVLGGTVLHPVLGGTICGFLALPIASAIRLNLGRYMARAKDVDGAAPYAFSAISRYSIGLVTAVAVSFGILNLADTGLTAITGAIIALITSALVSLIMSAKVSVS